MMEEEIQNLIDKYRTRPDIAIYEIESNPDFQRELREIKESFKQE